MLQYLTLLADIDGPEKKLIFAAVFMVGGLLCIMTGRGNIESKKATSGKAAVRLIRGSNRFEGNSAVLIGQVRILCGIAAIAIGACWYFFGK